MGRARIGKAGLDAGFVHDVDMVEDAADVARMGLARFVVDIEDGDLHARISKSLCARLAQPARAAGDHRSHARFDFHGFPLLWFFCLWLSAYPARR